MKIENVQKHEIKKKMFVCVKKKETEVPDEIISIKSFRIY